MDRIEEVQTLAAIAHGMTLATAYAMAGKTEEDATRAVVDAWQAPKYSRAHIPARTLWAIVAEAFKAEPIR